MRDTAAGTGLRGLDMVSGHHLSSDGLGSPLLITQPGHGQWGEEGRGHTSFLCLDTDIRGGMDGSKVCVVCCETFKTFVHILILLEL